MGPPHGNSYIRQRSYGQDQPAPDITAYRGVHVHSGYHNVAHSYDGDGEYDPEVDQPEENDEAQGEEDEPGPGESHEEHPYACDRRVDGDEYEYED
jgi:hypothetical protein